MSDDGAQTMHRLVCMVCGRPIVDVQTWDDGTLTPLAPVTGAGQEPRGASLGRRAKDGSIRTVQRSGRIHDVSASAEASGCYGTGTDRFLLVCAGRTHRREITMRRETLWRTCRSARVYKIRV